MCRNIAMPHSSCHPLDMRPDCRSLVQNLWSGISKWVGFSKQQMGLIAVLRHSEGSGHYSLAQSFKTEEPCTAIEINIGEDAAGGSPSSSKCVYVGQQDGLVEVYKLDSSDSLTRDWGFTAHSLDVTCLKLVGENKETLVTCGLDRRLRIYDVANRNFVADIEVGGAGIACLLTEASYFMVSPPCPPDPFQNTP